MTKEPPYPESILEIHSQMDSLESICERIEEAQENLDKKIKKLDRYYRDLSISISNLEWHFNQLPADYE